MVTIEISNPITICSVLEVYQLFKTAVKPTAFNKSPPRNKDIVPEFSVHQDLIFATHQNLKTPNISLFEPRCAHLIFTEKEIPKNGKNTLSGCVLSNLRGTDLSPVLNTVTRIFFLPLGVDSNIDIYESQLPTSTTGLTRVYFGMEEIGALWVYMDDSFAVWDLLDLGNLVRRMRGCGE